MPAAAAARAPVPAAGAAFEAGTAPKTKAGADAAAGRASGCCCWRVLGGAAGRAPGKEVAAAACPAAVGAAPALGVGGAPAAVLGAVAVPVPAPPSVPSEISGALRARMVRAANAKGLVNSAFPRVCRPVCQAGRLLFTRPCPRRWLLQHLARTWQTVRLCRLHTFAAQWRSRQCLAARTEPSTAHGRHASNSRPVDGQAACPGQSGQGPSQNRHHTLGKATQRGSTSAAKPLHSPCAVPVCYPPMEASPAHNRPPAWHDRRWGRLLLSAARHLPQCARQSHPAVPAPSVPSRTCAAGQR